MKPSISILAASPLCKNWAEVRTIMSIFSWLNYRELLVINICILLLVLAGCSPLIGAPPTPVSFESLCGLNREQFGVLDEAGVRQWIKGKYNFNPSATQREENGNLIVIYSWKKGNTTGNAYLREGHLFRISRYDVENGPTFGQVVDSLGPPETISSDKEVHEQVVYGVDLNYPKTGINVSTYNVVSERELEHEGSWAVRLIQNMQVRGITCYTPGGSMEEVLLNVFLISPLDIKIQMQRRMPWPGFGTWVSLDNSP